MADSLADLLDNLEEKIHELGYRDFCLAFYPGQGVYRICLTIYAHPGPHRLVIDRFVDRQQNSQAAIDLIAAAIEDICAALEHAEEPVKGRGRR